MEWRGDLVDKQGTSSSNKVRRSFSLGSSGPSHSILSHLEPNAVAIHSDQAFPTLTPTGRFEVPTFSTPTAAFSAHPGPSLLVPCHTIPPQLKVPCPIRLHTVETAWEWSQRTANYWRHFFGVPMRHGGNLFEDYYIVRTCNQPSPKRRSLATDLQGLLSSPSASGELLDLLTMEQRTTLTEVLQILSTSQSTSLADVDQHLT